MIYKHGLSCTVVCVIAIALALAAPQAAWACGGGVICVDTNADGAATGLSWTDAFTNVQDALTVASYGNEIWVAGGVYYPDEGLGQTNNVQTATFALKPGVALLGGFAGTQGSITIDMRDPEVYVTVLSGDIDGDDITAANGIITTTAGITGSNAYHVVTSDGVSETARLDGFTITGGSYQESIDEHTQGGGMLNTNSNPTLSNLIFSGNYAGNGGGMCNEQSSPTLTYVIFTGNEGFLSVGGMFNDQQSDPILDNVVFDNNQAKDAAGMGNRLSNPTLAHVIFNNNQATHYGGGGMYNYNSNPVLIDVTFSNNQANSSGGAMFNSAFSNPEIINSTFTGNSAEIGGGAMFNSLSNPTLTNAIVSGNQSDMFAGGLMNEDNSNTTLTNVTISGNLSNMYGGGLVNANGSFTLTNCILWGNHAITGTEIYLDEGGSAITATYSDVRWSGGAYTGTGNINADPQFVAPITATIAPTVSGNYRLQSTSPAIDAGNSLSVTAETDLDGNPRINGETVDMGAYETVTADNLIFLPLVLRN